MIEIVFEIIFQFITEILFDLVIQILGEIALEFGLASISEALKKDRRSNPILAFIGIIIMGTTLGFGVSWFFPERIMKISPIKGSSLILSPILAGVVMNAFGNWRRENGHNTGKLATFWGGAAFAFSFSVVRFIMIENII